METLLKHIIQLSSELTSRIDSCNLEDLDVYMQERDLIFTELQQYTPTPDQATAYRSHFERIIEMDNVIIGRMTVLRNEANHEIVKINKVKRSKTMYESVSHGEDSLFFDTKR